MSYLSPWIIALVGVAGGVGAVLRLFAAQWNGKLPWGILAANVLASGVVGFTANFFAVEAAADADLMVWASIGAVVVVGFAGGLSTFSSYAAQTVEFFRRGRIAQGLINTALNLLITPLAVWLGALAALALLK
ncbi:CrcB family protein [Rhodoluna sp. KAS3]|uniref:fluoride efflux transporter FluC n=1 Tax=Rhodoluna sp. KAS3 TaxID=942880 RepID=UPI00222F09DF|nr:CrcB family protein [Rhodoluna sp. KAS3]BDS49619.1 hypothetical protein RKAS3_11960 [Rhodoluna sp. KAS3]